MSRDRSLNRAHQKAFYQRLKADPALWRAFLDRRAAYKRRARSGVTSWAAVPTTAELIDAIVQRLARAGSLSHSDGEPLGASSERGGER